MGGMQISRRGRDLTPARRYAGGDRSCDFFGIETANMSPKAQIAAALSVLAPVTLGAIVVLSLVPQVFWVVFVFGWMVFPALGLLVRGIAGLSESADGSTPAPARIKEQELLRALGKRGELSATGAAMETSLTVAEADQMLGQLAERGYLEVRARGGGIFYALWGDRDGDEEAGVASLGE